MTGDLTQASDSVLVLAIGRWDEDALGEVFRRYAGAVFGVANQVLHDEGSSREITHDIFVRLWHEPDRFDPERGTLRAFLLNQSHSRAVERVRSDSRRRRREEADARGGAKAPYDLEREVWDMTLAAHVQQAMAQLPDDERQAIFVAYFGGHTYREVATLLGEPEGTVKSRIRSGLRHLQARLADAGVSGVDA